MNVRGLYILLVALLRSGFFSVGFWSKSVALDPQFEFWRCWQVLVRGVFCLVRALRDAGFLLVRGNWGSKRRH